VDLRLKKEGLLLTETLAVAMFLWFTCIAAGTLLLVLNYCFISMKYKRQSTLPTPTPPNETRNAAEPAPARRTFARGA
jgi:hypothetical protein